MERQAFARARRFFNYLPVAKWTALLSSVTAGVLFVALLAILGLFVDLVANHGEIPTFRQLPLREQNHFAVRMQPPEDAEARFAFLSRLRQELTEVGAGGAAQKLANMDNLEILSTGERNARLELLWLIFLPSMIDERVGPDAAEEVRLWRDARVRDHGLQRALVEPLGDFGILGLVLRSQNSVQGWLAAPLARWNAWMWQEGNQHYLQGLFLCALVLAIVRTGFIFLANYMAARATMEAITRLQRAVYHHTHRLGSLAIQALGPSEAISVFTRHVEGVHSGLYVWLTVVFREPAKFALLLAFAMLIHFWLALAFLLFAFLVWVLGGQMAAHFRRQGRVLERRAADYMALLQESLMMMRLVKVYLMEHFNQARVERQLSGHAAAELRRYRGEALYRPLFAFLGVLAAVMLLFLAGTMVLDNQLGIVGAVMLTTALVCLYWPTVRLLDARRLLRRARKSAQALFDFLDRPGTVGQAVEAEFLPPLSRSLEFDKVTLLEPGSGHKLLRGVSFTVQAGQRVALVGPDDMEKHALAYLIPRFLDPRDGEVRIDGKNIRWVTLDSLRAQCAIVLQHNLIFNDTVANNIGCGDPSYNLPRIIAAAKIAHAHHFIQKLPQGYETQIGDMGHNLTPGERFRIALARAILREPALLIIEEPLTLDEATKDMVDDAYARILPGRTAVFLPHRLSTIKNCDQVLLLHDGKIEAVGEHRDLLANNDLYRHLQYLEFNEFAATVPAPVPTGGAA